MGALKRWRFVVAFGKGGWCDDDDDEDEDEDHDDDDSYDYDHDRPIKSKQILFVWSWMVLDFRVPTIEPINH